MSGFRCQLWEGEWCDVQRLASDQRSAFLVGFVSDTTVWDASYQPSIETKKGSLLSWFFCLGF